MQVVIPDHELARRMGLPSAAELERSTPGLAARARAWFDECFAPYTVSHRVDIASIDGPAVALGCGTVLRGPVLAERLASARAHAIAAVAWTAGPALDEAVTKLWTEGRFDESYALDALGSAAVEHMRTAEAERELVEARARGWAALAPYSPGYAGWPLEDQPVLWELLAGGRAELRERIRCLPSGMLVPRKSQLAVVGLTRYPELAFRRHEYPRKALERWSRDLLTLTRTDSGTIEARFRLEGSTCGNVALTIDFTVRLGGGPGAWFIDGGDCSPAPGDRGCGHMCCSTRDSLGGAFEAARESQPLVGQPLADALDWNPTMNPAGCICGAEQLHHKWRIVYHTIAFALENHAPVE
jgi:hypothetical protein